MPLAEAMGLARGGNEEKMMERRCDDSRGQSQPREWGKEGVLGVWAGCRRRRHGVASLVWAEDLLGDEPPRDACPALKVQLAALREEPNSTHHPQVESEGKKGACAWSR